MKRLLILWRVATLGLAALPSFALADPPADSAAAKLIAHFKMQKIPQEGCWFALTYVSQDTLDGKTLPDRYQGKSHAAGSAIYALETREDFSAMHKLQTDEIWHFYGGDPIEMLLLYPDGHSETVILGADPLKGERPQFVVPRGVWQGSMPVKDSPEAYSLFGDTLAPAFDYADAEFGYRDELQKAYPQFAAHIARLTREDFARRGGK